MTGWGLGTLKSFRADSLGVLERATRLGDLEVIPFGPRRTHDDGDDWRRMARKPHGSASRTGNDPRGTPSPHITSATACSDAGTSLYAARYVFTSGKLIKS